MGKPAPRQRHNAKGRGSVAGSSNSHKNRRPTKEKQSDENPSEPSGKDVSLIRTHEIYGGPDSNVDMITPRKYGDAEEEVELERRRDALRAEVRSCLYLSFDL